MNPKTIRICLLWLVSVGISGILMAATPFKIYPSIEILDGFEETLLGNTRIVFYSNNGYKLSQGQFTLSDQYNNKIDIKLSTSILYLDLPPGKYELSLKGQFSKEAFTMSAYIGEGQHHWIMKSLP